MSAVDTRTGEITEPGTALAPIDKTAVSVVTTLENARHWLATAVEMTGPAEIATAKAHLATAETYARELRLSKDIQLDAAEMVRRAEYALGKSIRKGQAEGVIETPEEAYRRAAAVREVNQGRRDPSALSTSIKPRPLDFASKSELRNTKGDILDMVDGVDQEDFEAALDDARAEGNLSRANIVRKVKGQAGPTTRDERADVIADLAVQGWSSRQMPKRVGISEEAIRKIARDFDIEIPADKYVRGTRRLNHTQMVENAVTGLDDLVTALSLIDFNEVDPTEADEWAASLTDSIAALNRFKKQIKEMTHV